MEPFAPPQWTARVTAQLNALLSDRYSLTESRVDRHGSWEWVATGADSSAQSLAVSVTPLAEEAAGLDAYPQSLSIAVWRFDPSSSQIDPDAVAQKRVSGLGAGGRDDERVSAALAATVGAGLDGPRDGEKTNLPATVEEAGAPTGKLRKRLAVLITSGSLASLARGAVEVITRKLPRR
jgi:hypothetical protein